MMKLHFHPLSPASQPVLLFCADAGIAFEPVVVDIMTGEHHQERFIALNPNALVPVLEDGDFVLTESAAILRYLADAVDSHLYPKDLKARARVNERMDWFNSNLYRELGYHLVYPQLFPHHARAPEVAQAATIAWGREKAERMLGVLDRHLIGQSDYLTGDELSIADYFGSPILAVGELVGMKLDRFPNVDRWMTSLRSRPTWRKIHEPSGALAASLATKTFVSIN